MRAAIRVLAPAKINLTLEVLGRRPDGFHDLISVLQTVDVCDELEIAAAGAPDFSCSDPSLASADNLAWRAVAAMARSLDRPPHVALALRKQIPVAAGLGGGSSDAAAVIRGLCALWGVPYKPVRLVDIASELGSDVPFFLYGGTALVEGRGERVTPLAVAAEFAVLLLPGGPARGGKTGMMFHKLSPNQWSNGEATRRVVTRWPVDVTKLLPPEFPNAFESVAPEVFPDHIDRIRALVSSGALYGRLCGAGPTLFSVFGSVAAAEPVAGELRRRGFAPIVCRALGSLPPVEGPPARSPFPAREG